MNPIELAKTVYLGDRAVKGIVIDTWRRIVKVQIDKISRIRSGDGMWNFYNDENIANGYLVFHGVQAAKIEPAGNLPNDYVVEFTVSETRAPTFEGYVFCLVSADSDRGSETVIQITATDFSFEDPLKPGQEIKA
jgi:hypothetical protein